MRILFTKDSSVTVEQNMKNVQSCLAITQVHVLLVFLFKAFDIYLIITAVTTIYKHDSVHMLVVHIKKHIVHKNYGNKDEATNSLKIHHKG